MPYPLRITAREGALVLAVTLPVETYVERVVASESGPADSIESLKALAIVVRSFASHQKHSHAEYDLCDSTHCQLLHWGKAPDRAAAAHRATLTTAGQTLWYRGQRAEAWFHQSCGGRTATPAEAWPLRPGGREAPHKTTPWLVSQADKYCTAAGARIWSSRLSLAELTDSLAKAGIVSPGWMTLSVERRGESGRAVTLKIGNAEVSAEDFRLAVGRNLGWSRILSNWYEVSAQNGQYSFYGRGSGHGVGLCQAGAAAMSAAEHNSSEILDQYFPGAHAADEVTGRPWQIMRGDGFLLETLTPADVAFVSRFNQALAEAETLSGLKPTATITVRAFNSTAAFRNATLAPGWVAAFTEGNWIGTQPLATIASRKLLGPILRHEFLHALVESHAAPSTPLWLREGLVEALSEEKVARRRTPPALPLDTLDQALAHAATETDSVSAHQAAAWYAGQLLNRCGRVQTLAWLQSGVPADALSFLH